MLKPHVDLLDTGATGGDWRGDIGRHFSAAEWDAWFASYRPFIMHYAHMAQEHGVSMLAVSTELIAASPQEAHWRATIAEIRSVYKGTLTDAANWGGEEVNKTWWDAVDVIGVDAYYPLWDHAGPNPPLDPVPTVDELVAAWQPVVPRLESLAAQWNKSVMFTEIGFCSGTSRQGCGLPATSASRQLQANAFEATLRVWTAVPVWIGVHWWNIVSDPSFTGTTNGCMDPRGKPAESVLRHWYGAPPRPCADTTSCPIIGERKCTCFL